MLLPAPFSAVPAKAGMDVMRAVVAGRQPAGGQTVQIGTPLVAPASGPGALIASGSLTPSAATNSLAHPETQLLLDEIRIDWGEVHRAIPLGWFLDYEWHERFTKVGTFLGDVWHDVIHTIGAHGIDLGALDAIIGCYNIDWDRARIDVGPWMFYRHGDDPAREFLRYTLAMIAAYHALAIDEWSGTDYCDDFAPFVGKLFKGKRAVNRVGHGCTLRVQVRSTDPRFDDERVKTCAPGHDTGRPCGEEVSSGDKIGSGAFDDWEPQWEDGEYPWLGVDAPYSTDTSSEPAKFTNSTGAVGDGQGFSIFFHAVLAAFDGYVFDYAMYVARLLVDYGREMDQAECVEDGVMVSRWQLLKLVDRGRLLIHEAGHLWIGEGGHCRWGICFEYAAQAWVCGVQGLLGLGTVRTYPSDRLPRYLEMGHAGTEDQEYPGYCVFDYVCFIGQPGEPGVVGSLYSEPAVLE